MRVLIIDNYDSFTYNLYQATGEILTSAQAQKNLEEFSIIIKRNDKITLDEIQQLNPDRIIISAGPGAPDDERYFGVCGQVIKQLGPQIPLLGICLGMQGIVHAFGGNIVPAALPMHGKTDAITHSGTEIFCNVPNPLEVMRYHSLIAEFEHLPECLEITASILAPEETEGELADASATRQIMAIKHRSLPITGIQFHPESFATEGGKELIANFLFAA